MSVDTRNTITLGDIPRQVLQKILVVLEIVVGYIAFSLTGAVGVWLIFGKFIPLGRLFGTMSGLHGISVLFVSLIKAVLFLIVVYALQRLHHLAMKDLGLQLPSTSWQRFLMLAIGLALVGQGMLFVVQKLIGESAETNLPVFDIGTPLSVLGWIGVGWIHGGFCEELLYRGFLLSRFEMLFGKRWWGTTLAVVLLVVFFGLGHAYQGVTGIILTAITSLVFWGVYFLSRRNLWASVIAHGCWDMIAWLLMASGI